MKYLILIFSSFIFILSTSNSVKAQYSEQAIVYRMWKNVDPDFEVTEVPEKWKNESVVILCKRISFEYKKQSMAAKVNKDFYLRKRIKLLDKAAVDRFSEFSFDDLKKKSNSRDGEFFGIKIIKPDGTEKIINIDDAVELNSYKNSKERTKRGEGYNKLAIPDLEVNDIIDYYYVSINTLSTRYTGGNRYVFDPEFIPLKEIDPILKGKIRFLPERKCYINISVSNGAPEPKKEISMEKIYHVVEYADLDKTKAKLWYYPLRQDPTIKFQAIIAPQLWDDSEMQFLGMPEVPKTSVSNSELKRLLNNLDSRLYNNNTGGLKAAGSKFLRKKRLSEDPNTLVSELYYCYRNYLYFKEKNYYGSFYPYFMFNSEFNFVEAFSDNLVEQKIVHEIGLGVDRSVGVIDSVVMLSEITPFIKVVENGKPLFITYPSQNSLIGDGDYFLENTKVFTKTVTPGSSSKQYTYDTIPICAPIDNLQTDSVFVNFDSTMSDTLLVDYKYSLSGSAKYYFNYLMLLPNDYYPNEFSEIKKIRKFNQVDLDNMNNREKLEGKDKKKNEEERDEILKEWLSGTHMVEEVNLTSVDIAKLGRNSNEPNLDFNLGFKTPDMVKKSGDYLIIETGKLFGRNYDLSESEKDRKLDVYLSYPRQIDWYVEINIPKGYSATNVENLNKKLENEYAGFESSAEIIKDKIIIHASKYYASNFVSLENWEEFLSALDEANSFIQQKIALKKLDLAQ